MPSIVKRHQWRNTFVDILCIPTECSEQNGITQFYFFKHRKSIKQTEDCILVQEEVSEI